MLKVPLGNPKPDFEEFEKVLKGEKCAKRMHFVETGVDPEVISFIIENFLGQKAITFYPETKEDFLWKS